MATLSGVVQGKGPTMMSCRVCGTHIGETFLTLRGMPSSAQNLPSADQLDVDRGEDLRVVQCSACGLVQVDCQPVPYYKEVIRSVAFSEEMRGFRRLQLRDFAALHCLTGKPVIEIGCGRGEYLELLSEAGMCAAGTEYGVANCQEAVRAGHRVFPVFPDSSAESFDGEAFAAFFTFNFMEHWPDPRAVLLNVRAHLVPGGVGLVEVPNLDMLVEKQMCTEFVSDHLSYFTAESLRTTLLMSGFEVLEIREVWHRYILSATVRKRESLDFGPFEAALNAQRNRVLKFVNGAGRRGVAVWGAGHQALAAMALMGLHGKVRYVVDSAPFKQGRFTPATHLPIRPPDALDTDPVDAILIIAAGFSDEVASIISRRWGPIFKVAILREDDVEEL